MLTIVLSIFLLSYWNMGFVILKSYERGTKRGFVGWIP
jgi:hypothetical protein